jgi:hypothetical protein
LTVIGLDLITKLIALRFAPIEPLELWNGAIEIRLMENASLLGTMHKKAGNLSQLFVSGIVALVLATGGLMITSARDRPAKKFLVVLGMLLGALAALYLPVHFQGLTSARFVGASRTFGILACNTLILRVVLNRRIFTVGSLFASASLANLLNSVWHPAGVIDFIWIRALRHLLGVANVADLVMTFTGFWAELLIVIWLSVELLWRLSPTQPRRRARRAFFVSTFHQ